MKKKYISNALILWVATTIILLISVTLASNSEITKYIYILALLETTVLGYVVIIDSTIKIAKKYSQKPMPLDDKNLVGTELRMNELNHAVDELMYAIFKPMIDFIGKVINRLQTGD